MAALAARLLDDVSAQVRAIGAAHGVAPRWRRAGVRGPGQQVMWAARSRSAAGRHPLDEHRLPPLPARRAAALSIVNRDPPCTASWSAAAPRHIARPLPMHRAGKDVTVSIRSSRTLSTGAGGGLIPAAAGLHPPARYGCRGTGLQSVVTAHPISSASPSHFCCSDASARDVTILTRHLPESRASPLIVVAAGSGGLGVATGPPADRDRRRHQPIAVATVFPLVAMRERRAGACACRHPVPGGVFR